MKKRCRRIAGLILAFAIAAGALLFAPAGAETLQDCHKVTNTYQDKKAQTRRWSASGT